MPAQENARIVGLIILIIWLIASPDSRSSTPISSRAAARLRESQVYALGALQTTRWGDLDAVVACDAGINGTNRGLVNITGFREEDNLAWAALPRFRERCVALSEYAYPKPVGESLAASALPTVWRNVSGSVRGTWARTHDLAARWPLSYNLSRLDLENSWDNHAELWNWNATGTEGRIKLHLKEVEEPAEDVASTHDTSLTLEQELRSVRATINLEDSGPRGSSSTFAIKLHGVHWPQQGSILLTTTSDKFAGIFGLPHLTTSEGAFNSSQAFLKSTLKSKIDAEMSDGDKPTLMGSRNPWSARDELDNAYNSAPFCEYVVFLQVQPLEMPAAETWMKEVEQELRTPIGRPMPHIPELRMSGVIYSPDCGFILESKGPPHYTAAQGDHLVGWNQDVLARESKLWLFVYSGIVLAQIMLTKYQMRLEHTPSALGRVSFWTLSTMLMADGMTFIPFSVINFDPAVVQLASLILTGALFMAMVTNGMYLSEAYKAQEAEWRQLVPAVVSTAQPRVQDDAPVLVPFDQDVDAEIAEIALNAASAIPIAEPTLLPLANAAPRRTQFAVTPFSRVIGKFFMVGIFLTLLTASSTGWYPWVQALYKNILMFMFASLWVPQIIRNTLRNSRRAFTWRFMVGQSVLRILPMAYFYLNDDNLLFAEPDWISFALLVSWLSIQLLVLSLQDVLGPRYGLPKRWLDEAWDYHPVLAEDAAESGVVPIGLLADSTPSSPTSYQDTRQTRAKGDGNASSTRHTTCVICTETLEVAISGGSHGSMQGSTALSGVGGLLERRKYMVTPCRHIFHAKCLEGWMRFRLICPICRESIPPL